jgi:hypothetical protein
MPLDGCTAGPRTVTCLDNRRIMHAPARFRLYLCMTTWRGWSKASDHPDRGKQMELKLPSSVNRGWSQGWRDRTMDLHLRDVVG